jgi:hypothetical protein
MDFFQAMDHMKRGDRVKLKSWPYEKYIGVKEEEMKVFGRRKIKYTAVNSDETDVPPVIPFSVLVSCEWELSHQD